MADEGGAPPAPKRARLASAPLPPLPSASDSEPSPARRGASAPASRTNSGWGAAPQMTVRLRLKRKSVLCALASRRAAARRCGSALRCEVLRPRCVAISAAVDTEQRQKAQKCS